MVLHHIYFLRKNSLSRNLNIQRHKFSMQWWNIFSNGQLIIKSKCSFEILNSHRVIDLIKIAYKNSRWWYKTQQITNGEHFSGLIKSILTWTTCTFFVTFLDKHSQKVFQFVSNYDYQYSFQSLHNWYEQEQWWPFTFIGL